MLARMTTRCAMVLCVLAGLVSAPTAGALSCEKSGAGDAHYVVCRVTSREQLRLAYADAAGKRFEDLAQALKVKLIQERWVSPGFRMLLGKLAWLGASGKFSGSRQIACQPGYAVLR